MSDVHRLTEMIVRLDTNQMALQAAIEKVASWICRRGSEAVADSVASTLQVLSENADFIGKGIADLTASTCPSK